jgi:hypothetical protein
MSVRATTTTAIDTTGIENMQIAGDSDGQGNFFFAVLYYDELTAAEKTTYDSAVNLFALDGNTEVINTMSDLDIDRMTSQPSNFEASEVVDFATLSATDQEKLRDFLALAVSKGTVG